MCPTVGCSTEEKNLFFRFSSTSRIWHFFDFIFTSNYFWPKIGFFDQGGGLHTILIFVRHLDFWTKFWFLTKMLDFLTMIWTFAQNFDLKLDFWPLCGVLNKLLIFDLNLDFWTKFLLFTSIYIFEHDFDFLIKFWFLTKILIFG